MVLQTGSSNYCAQWYEEQALAFNVNLPYYTFILPPEYCLAAYADPSVTRIKIKYKISVLNNILGA